jgi:hypothetical protein
VSLVVRQQRLLMTINEHVMATVTLMLAEPGTDEDAFFPRLVAAGCSPLQARLLVLLVPLALGRAAIAGRPGMPAAMPEAVAFPKGDRWYYVRLAAIPDFAAAVEAASSGVIAPDQVATVGARSSELHAIQGAMEAGQDLTRSHISEPMFVGLADDPGFEKWFGAFGPRDHQVVELNPSPKRSWWRFW